MHEFENNINLIDSETNKNIDLTPDGKLVNSKKVAYNYEIQCNVVKGLRDSPADHDLLNDGFPSNSLSIISRLDEDMIE